MQTWQAFLLGLVQGITEFLPVSSSGHLALAQYVLGFENLHHYVLFNLICHVGTLIAILIVFFPTIKQYARPNSPYFWQVVIGTLPLVGLIFVLKPLKALFDHPQLLGPCFLFSACLLFSSVYLRLPTRFVQHQSLWLQSFFVGIFQLIAIFPGISRSGSTISGALLMGWTKEKAFQFSFLLAIPAILGGALVEGIKAWTTTSSDSLTFHPDILAIGFLTSFIVGYFSLQLLMRWIIQDKWKYFAWYCLILGISTTLYFNSSFLL